MATIKYKDPATGEIRKIPFVVGNSTPESFDGVLPLEKGGTSSSAASGARTNLMVPQKPKLLWSVSRKRSRGNKGKIFRSRLEKSLFCSTLYQRAWKP